MTAEASSAVEIHEAPGRMPSAYGEEYWREKAGDWKKRSIYKVPAYVRGSKTEAYQPRVVSLGPYHHDEKHPKPMEEHKARALCYFLKRSGKPLVEFQKALSKVLDDVMDCYDQLDEKWRNDRDAFLQLMILDGAFMLEILQTGAGSSNDYPVGDPIFGHHGKLNIMPAVKRDMLMLENQLPMLVLDKLVAVRSDGSEKDEECVNKLMLKFCCQPALDMKLGKCLHLLDVFRKSQIPGDQSNSTGKGSKWDVLRTVMPQMLNFLKNVCSNSSDHSEGTPIMTIPSATELQEAGIRFKKSRTKSLTDITFSKGKGILTLPPVTVDDATESKFFNLVAFERLHIENKNEISSYICLMDEIIDTENDVALLRRKGIIRSAIGSDKATAELFNSLSREVTLSLECSLQTVQDEIGKYCEQSYNRWRANLCHTYFNSPWTVMSLIAAFFLFGLTIVQTIFTILPYYQ